MKKRTIEKILILGIIITAASLLFTAVTFAYMLPEGKAKKAGAAIARYAPDRVVVKLKSGADPVSILAKGEFRIIRLAPREKDSTRGYPYEIKVPPGTTVKKMVEDLNKNPLVDYAEPVYKVHALWSPNDPYYYTNQPRLRDIQCEPAWDITQGNANIVIAITDTGIDPEHEDLSGKLWINPDEIPGNNKDDDNNGYIDDWFGYNFELISGGGLPLDDNGHGTHCSGIAAAATNNGLGIAGVCPNARIMPVKFLDYEGSGFTISAAEAIVYAADNGARIISCSWGSPDYSRLLEEAINYAYNKGCFIVAAAGNDGFREANYPAGYKNVFSVGALSEYGAPADFSNYGKKVDVIAPGVDIYSTMPHYRVALNDYAGVPLNYAYLSGTSMACPHVAGEAALILSLHPEFTPLQIANAIRIGARPDIVSSDKYIGSGTISLPDTLNITDPPSIEAQISDPAYGVTASPYIPVSGRATGASYILTASSTGPYTSDWILVNSGGAVDNGLLGIYDTSALALGKYFIKSTVIDQSGYDISRVTEVSKETAAQYEAWIESITPQHLTMPIPGKDPPELKIKGINFGGEKGVLRFGGQEAAVNSWSNTEISCSLPSLPVGAHAAALTTSDGKNTNAVNFVIDSYTESGPRINWFIPNYITRENEISIYGSGFGQYTRGCKVRIENISMKKRKSMEIISWSDNRIVCSLNPGGLWVGPYYLSVITPDLESNRELILFLNPTPRIDSVTPVSCPSGTKVTVKGRGLGKNLGKYGPKVWLGQMMLKPSKWNDEEMVFKVPHSYAHTYPLYIYEGPQSIFGVPIFAVTGVSNVVDFTVTGPAGPCIDRYETSYFLPAWFADVTIHGVNFGTADGVVKFGGKPTIIKSWSDTKIECWIPPTIDGWCDITVTVPGGKESNGVFTNVFWLSKEEWDKSPKLMMVSPAGAAAGSQVTVYGFGFGKKERGKAMVKFNQTEASVESWSDMAITCTIPVQIPAGQSAITVVKNNGKTGSINFNVTAKKKKASR